MVDGQDQQFPQEVQSHVAVQNQISGRIRSISLHPSSWPIWQIQYLKTLQEYHGQSFVHIHGGL